MKRKFNIKDYFSEILTGLIVIALLSYLFVGIGIKEKLDDEFWTLFGIGFIIMIAITSIWYPNAKTRAKLKDKNFRNQQLEYSLLVDKVVKTNNFKGLKKFCDYASSQNKITKIENVLIRLNIDFDLFNKYKKDIRLIEKDTQLSDKQKKKLKKLIVNGVKYSKINSNKVTTAIDNVKECYDIKSQEKAYDVKTLTAKIITSILCTLGFAMIAFTGTGFTLGKLAQILTWICLIAWNICQSIITGTKSISVFRADFYKKLRTFLEEFFASEYADKSVEWTRPKITEDENN